MKAAYYGTPFTVEKISLLAGMEPGPQASTLAWQASTQPDELLGLHCHWNRCLRWMVFLFAGSKPASAPSSAKDKTISDTSMGKESIE